jgi:predicted metal-dependent peptidase
MKATKISDKEFQKIYDRLFLWTGNKVLADMWKYGERMVFSDEYTHAALEFVDGHFRINANPKYWKRITKFQKVFLICHELLHLAFGHWAVPDNMDREWVNVAQDIQVNEYIRANYRILTQKMKNEDAEAWIETVFKDKADLVEKDRDFHYYYGLLMKCLA